MKESVFLPSGKRIATVVGRLGDEFINIDGPYCSCSHFYFRVAGGREETCYHLLAYRIAKATGKIQTLEFSDDEYGPYFAALVGDVFEMLDKGG